MAGRYYLVTVTGPVNRWTRIVDALGPVPGRRQLPNQLIHWRESLDGKLRIVQAETDAAEHAYLISLAWVSYLGPFDEVTKQADPAVDAYIAANRGAWETPMGS